MARTGTLETEIKLRITGGARAAARLLKRHGYAAQSRRNLQADQLFDLPGGVLRNSSRLLRVRLEGGAAVLTYKGPPRPGPHKSREELETTVEDDRALRAILDRLGFKPAFRYEKYRTTFEKPEEHSAGSVELDETPIGVFLELEGPAEWIDRVAQELGFSAADYITASYGSLYRQYLKQHGGATDMLFAESRTTRSNGTELDDRGSKNKRATKKRS